MKIVHSADDATIIFCCYWRSCKINNRLVVYKINKICIMMIILHFWTITNFSWSLHPPNQTLQLSPVMQWDDLFQKFIEISRLKSIKSKGHFKKKLHIYLTLVLYCWPYKMFWQRFSTLQFSNFNIFVKLHHNRWMQKII